MALRKDSRSFPVGLNWILLRLTGLVLSVLVLGHFALTHIVNDVATTDSDYVADRFGDTFFIAWDALMLWTAVLHGAVGMWIIIGEHAPRRVHLWRGLFTAGAAAMATGGSIVLVVAG